MMTGGGGPDLSKAIRSLEVLSIGGQCLHRLANRFFPRAKGQHVGQADASMRADAPERQQTNIHSSPHQRA